MSDYKRLPVAVARAVLMNKKNEFLLGLRADTDRWEFPGGKLEHMEDPEEAAKRECLEECRVRVSGMKEVVGHKTIKHLSKEKSSFEVYVAFSEWEGQAAPGEPNHLSWAWFTRDAAKDLPLMPSTRYALECLIPDFLKQHSDWPPKPMINLGPVS